MQARYPSLFAAAAILSLFLLPPGRAGAEPGSEVMPGEVLVGIRPLSDNAATSQRLAATVGAEIGHQSQLHVRRLRLRPGMTIDAAVARLQQEADVLYAEPNHVYRISATPNDSRYANQYGPQKVQADSAWGIWNPKSAVILAIVDTGIDYTHPDLTNKILRDNTGAVIGHNSVGTNAHSGVATDPIDDFGHGTHCAGIAAAQINNATGIAGIAGWNGQAGSSDTTFTKLMPVKVLDSTGSGTDLTVADGITWAADHGAKVISLSLGGGGSTTLQSAVQHALNAGSVVVAAAGNSGSSALSFPGGYAGVISVAATDTTDTLASFSNFGSWVTTAAPGVNILSTTPTYTAAGGFPLSYGNLSGTSMATPHAAGEAALILAQNPALTQSQVLTIITQNTDPYNPIGGRTIATGAGRINVFKALNAAGGAGPAPVPAAPTGLKATAGNTQVGLTWNPSAGAAIYNVYRRTATTAQVHRATVTNPAFTDTGLTNGTTYFYQVSAVNKTGESAKSAEVSATPTAAPPAQQLLVNPGFENGATNPAPWVVTAGVVDNSSFEAPHSGLWKAWLDGYGFTHTDAVQQTVAIPSTVTTATLSFWLHIDTAESGTTAFDTLQVQIRNTSGVVLATLATYSNVDAAAGYAQKTFDISAFKGQTIQVRLTGTEDSSLQTSFVVDDFALNVQ